MTGALAQATEGTEADHADGWLCCGAIQYEVTGEPFNLTACHCSDCRRITAAPFTAWFTVAASGFLFVHGEARRFASSAAAVRSFRPD